MEQLSNKRNLFHNSWKGKLKYNLHPVDHCLALTWILGLQPEESEHCPPEPEPDGLCVTIIEFEEEKDIPVG